jgi:hypothetical protein
MQKIYGKEHVLTKISMLLEPKDMISFSSLNKTINRKLNPLTSSAMNKMFYLGASREFFNMNEDYIEDENLSNNDQNVLESEWKGNINWKAFYCKISKHFNSYPDKEISEKIKEYFKIHLFLMYLRKENRVLEYKNSSVHQTIIFDKNIKDIYTYNYYDKYINSDYLFGENGSKNVIKSLRKDLPFQDELTNFRNIYNEFSNNSEYRNILNMILSYDFENLDLVYEQIMKNGNKNMNKIINFVLWSIRSFIFYIIYNYESVIRFDKDKDEDEFLIKFNKAYNSYINAALLTDSNFENINIIINYLDKFLNGNNQDKNVDKFSLYQLYFKIFEKKIFEKLEKKINLKASLKLRKYLNELINKENDKNVCEAMETDEAYKTRDCTPNCSQDEMEYLDDIDIESDLDFESKFEDIDLLSEVTNSFLDMDVNKDNSLAINHSCVKLGDNYDRHEDMLDNELKFFLEKNIKEKSTSEVFEVIEKSLKNNGNSRIFGKNSLNLINRTKKKLLKNAYKILVPNIISNLEKSFSSHLKYDENTKKRVLILEHSEITNNKEYNYDLSNFSQKNRMKIEGKVNEEINNIKSCLYEQNINGFNIDETVELVNKYMDNNGIEVVLFVKKMIYFYYGEMQTYEEIDKSIENILKKENNCCSYPLNEILKIQN